MFTKVICYFGKILLAPFVKRFSPTELKSIDASKILIIKSGAIGDVLMTAPFLRALRKRFPSAEIDYLTGKENSSVLEANKNISNLISVESKYFHSLNPAHKIKLLNTIREKKYEMCFIMDKSWLANVFIWLTRVPIRIGFDRFGEGFANNANIKYGELKHEIEYYLELVYLVGAKDEKNKNLELYLTEEDKKFANKIFRQFRQQTTNYRPQTTDCKTQTSNLKPIAIAPGGGKNPGVGVDSTRIWPEQNFISLVNMLKNKKIFLIGGEKDKEICNRIVEQANPKIRNNLINLAGQTSLKQSAAVMQKCSCIITNDAGSMHIASAVNNKVISIFGPTHPLRKAPLNKESKWIWTDEDKYDWRCDVYSTRYAEGRRFMEDVTPKLVFEAIKEVLKK